MYRRMLRIPWTARVSNVEVMDRMGKELEVLYKIRRLEYFGHIIHNGKYRLLQLEIEDMSRPGRRKTSWLKI